MPYRRGKIFLGKRAAKPPKQRSTALLGKQPRVPYHRVGVGPKNFSFSNKKEWSYKDRRPHVLNDIGKAT